MPRLIAIRQLTGDYGCVDPGQQFETDAETAESLESRGLAYVYRPPRSLAERKAMQAPENKAMQVSGDKGHPFEFIVRSK